MDAQQNLFAAAAARDVTGVVSAQLRNAEPSLHGLVDDSADLPARACVASPLNNPQMFVEIAVIAAK